MKTAIIKDKNVIEEIINNSSVCFVSMVDCENKPYVIPMNFGYKEDTLYLHSGPEGSKLEILKNNNNVCITLSEGAELVYQHPKIACSYSMKSRSVICKGKVEFVEDLNLKRQYLDLIMKHYTDNEIRYSDPAIKNVVVWKIHIEELTAKAFGLRGYETV